MWPFKPQQKQTVVPQGNVVHQEEHQIKGFTTHLSYEERRMIAEETTKLVLQKVRESEELDSLRYYIVVLRDDERKRLAEEVAELVLQKIKEAS